jgi:hypothetical protein
VFLFAVSLALFLNPQGMAPHLPLPLLPHGMPHMHCCPCVLQTHTQAGSVVPSRLSNVLFGDPCGLYTRRGHVGRGWRALGCAQSRAHRQGH